MGERRDRIHAVARYLRSASGIPAIGPDGSFAISAPYPYVINIHTGREFTRWSEDVEKLGQDNVQALVWYRGGRHDSPADAIVTMRASTFAALLHTHYEAGAARRNGGE